MIAGERQETNNAEYALVVEHEPWHCIELECTKAQDRETGGILIGYYTEDESTAIITEASAPPRDSIGGGNWFQRGLAGLKTLLLRRWNQKQRMYYLGEWHYHPTMHIEPSHEDIHQLWEIRASPNYHCQEPIMLIVGQATDGVRPVRLFVFPRGKRYFEYQRLPSEIP